MLKPAAILLLVALLLPTAALSAARVALIVGNGAYQHAPALINPANDAALIAASLETIGFKVIRLTDAGRQQLLGAMSEFGREARGADIALFFYAGHGLEVAGRNWVLPVDADIQASSDLPAAAVRVDDILESMELSEARVRLVILDACRNNPLPRSLTRAASRGLARIDASAAGTMIVFSAAPGEVALDGSGANSPFSMALARHVTEPGIEIRQMMGRVRADVLAATGDQQVPWVNEAVVGDYYLAGPGGEEDRQAAIAPADVPAASAQPSAELAVELAFWNSVQDSRSKQLLELYLKRYPHGTFRELAEAKIAALNNLDATARSTPSEPASQPTAPQPESRTELEARARAFVQRLNTVISGPADLALASLPDIYAGEVDFYGKRFTLAEIEADKRKLIERWPERSYQAPESEMTVYCNPAALDCDVRAVIYWSVSSPARKASASGVSLNNWRIDFAGGVPRVVYESGETVRRN